MKKQSPRAQRLAEALVYAPEGPGVARGAGRHDIVRQFGEWPQRGRRLKGRE